MNGSGMTIKYEKFGNGEKTVVLLHGFGGFKEMWDWQISDLSPLARLIVPDLPGHGESEWHNEDLADMADQVRAVLEKEGVRQAHFVASSFGGLVALTFWENFPERVTRLSFVGSLPRFTSEVGYPAGLDAEKIGKLATQLEGDVGIVLDMFYRSLFTRVERDSLQYGLIKGLRHGAPLPQREASLAMLDLLEITDLRGALQRVKVPVQFIFGDSDDLCPPEIVPSLKSLCPSGIFSVIDDAGHFPFMSWPDEVNALLREFIVP
jgi:pimeloyl-[acyl-carrier protein] methyl ester esterase